MLAALCILVVYIAYREVFYAVPKADEDAYAVPGGEQYKKIEDRMHTLIGRMEQLPYELLFIQAWDGTRLVGRYYHVEDGAPFQIQFHGYRGRALRDFCGGNKLAREIITGYDGVAVTPLEDNPTVCLVEFRFTVAHGLNQIWLSANITV